MSRAIAWFAKNSVAANLLMLVIIAAGLVTVFSIKLEVFPEISLDTLTVTMEYRGASPEEVEEGVNVRIEEAIQGLDGVKRITSLANEGFGVVTIELELGADSREVLDDVKSRVDAIDTFPEETEQPVYQEVTNRNQVINLAVFGDADERVLRRLADRVRDEISALPGITIVEFANARPYEISIEVPENALRRHGLTFDEVAAAVRSSSLDLPAGSVKTQGGEILLRTKGQAYVGQDFEQLMLLTRPDGSQLRLGDIAQVRDGFEDTDQSTRFDGKPAVIIEVFRTGDQRALGITGILPTWVQRLPVTERLSRVLGAGIAETVKQYVDTARPRLPDGVELALWQDGSKVLQDRLTLLLRNGTQGFLLVILILALFLRFRLSLWVSIGLPISFLGAMWLMPGLDVSINLISLFAFIVVLGIVVDDAIIVGENIHHRQHRIGQGLQGSIEGAHEVSVPVVFAVLTSIAAFTPLLNVEGVIGKVMRVIPLIVIPTLAFSLIESLLILPAHLSHYRHEKPPPRWFLSRWWTRFQERFAAGLDFVIARVYRPGLERALEWRYLTVATGIAVLLITGALAGAGYIRFTFFPAVEADYISAAITMPQGTPVEVTSQAVAQLEASARRLLDRVEQETGQRVDQHVLAAVGEQPYLSLQQRNAGGARPGFAGAHLGEVTIELTPAETRARGSEALARDWRELTGPIADALEVNYTASLFNTGDDINVQLTGESIAELRQVAEILKRRISSYRGVYDVSDSFREGKQEVKLDILPAAEIYGLRLADVARQVRQAFYGEEAQRIQRGRDDIRVMVRYPETQRRSLGDLENMRIRTAQGLEVPFSEVAVVERGRGYATIKRVDRRRAVNVTASVDPAQGNAEQIIAELKTGVLSEVLADHPGVLYSFEGQQAQQRDTLGGLKRGFALALFVIFALLAIPLRSYVQPLLIMSAIPFGLVGAVWGHVIMGFNLTIMSVFGIVALAGVVVNDSLVMVTFVNRAREQGATLAEAAREAGSRRFRPILLTSLTTFGGLTPLLLEKSMQARFLIPMATSLAFGVMFATLVTLVLVPSGYLILEDLRRLVRRRPRAETPLRGVEEAA